MRFSECRACLLLHKFRRGNTVLFAYKIICKTRNRGKCQRPIQKAEIIRHARQMRPVIMLYELSRTITPNITTAKTSPITQANFFCAAPTYSGTSLFTIHRPMTRVGEYLGLKKADCEIYQESNDKIFQQEETAL